MILGKNPPPAWLLLLGRYKVIAGPTPSPPELELELAGEGGSWGSELVGEVLRDTER